MVRQYLTIKEFGGLNRSEQPSSVDDDQLVVCRNFWGMPDVSSSYYLDFLSKVQAEIGYTNTPAAGIGRGMYMFYNRTDPDVPHIMFVLCDGAYFNNTIYAYDTDAGAWKTLTTTLPLFAWHVDFEQYLDKVYMAAGSDNGFLKWYYGSPTAHSTQWATYAPKVQDTGATATKLTGTITFTNGLDTVTGVGTLFTTELYIGRYIRRSDTGSWYEVERIDDNTNLLLMEAFAEVTGAGALDDSEVCAECARSPKFIIEFKDKIFIAGCGESGSNLSRLWWSVTGNPEDWTSSGAGFVDVGYVNGKDQITGLGIVDDYLFVFKDYSYYVYRWTGATLYPIEFVRKYNYGCVSERTIKQVNNGLIYYTGRELRWTNGVNDMSLSGDIDEHLRVYGSTTRRSYEYWSMSATDNDYPSGVVDEYRGYYYLFNFSNANEEMSTYDYVNNIWSGTTDSNWAQMTDGFLWNDLFFYQHNSSQDQIGRISGSTFATADGLLRSKAYDFGAAQVNKKVHWVEFVFHPAISCSCVISFNYITDLSDFSVANSQSYSLLNDPITGTGNDTVRVRFPVNKNCRYFQWTLSDVATTGGWGLCEATICYEFLDTP